MHQTKLSILVLTLVCAQTPIGAEFIEQGNVAAQKPSPPEATATGVAPPRAPRPKAKSDNRLETLTGFTVDYPKKDWNPLVGSGSALLVFFHKNRDVTVAIERRTVPNALTVDEITDRTAKLEMDDWLSRRPLTNASGYQFIDYEGDRTIVIDFTQPGPRGPERVRLYTMPRGNDWYRVICTTTQTTYDKYKDACHNIAMSLTPVAR